MRILRPARPSGGVLIFALMCSAVGVIGLTFWIMTVTARSRYVDTLQDSARRRVARDNGRVLASRYLKARVLPANAGSAFSRGFGTWYSGLQNYEWGGVRLDAPWNGSPLTSNTGSTGVNRISYGDRGGFGLADSTGSGYDLPLTILDGDQTWSYRWQARSYSPMLAGDLLVVHPPISGNTPLVLNGVIEVNGRAHFHQADPDGTLGANVSFRAYGSQGPGWGSLVNTNAMVTNYPPIYSLSWAVAGTPVPGVSSVIWDPVSPGVSLRNKALDTRTVTALYTLNGGVASTTSNGYSSDGLGAVTIDLTNPSLDSVVVENVQTIDIIGQTTPTTWTDVAGYPTVLIVVHRGAGETFTPTTVNLRNKNNRRLVLAMRCESDPPAVALNFPEADQTMAGVGPDWRLMLVLEQTPVAFGVAGNSLNLTGGISTDRSVTAPNAPGALRLYRENAPVGLSTKTPRRAWVEGFRAD